MWEILRVIHRKEPLVQSSETAIFLPHSIYVILSSAQFRQGELQKRNQKLICLRHAPAAGSETT
jgi:hypothetical protein